MNKTVLVCQNRTCKSSNSPQVLKAFQLYSIPNVKLVGCGCLGQCGNGPIVLILPQKIWYQNVFPDRVKSIVAKHLLENTSEQLKKIDDRHKPDF